MSLPCLRRLLRGRCPFRQRAVPWPMLPRGVFRSRRMGPGLGPLALYTGRAAIGRLGDGTSPDSAACSASSVPTFGMSTSGVGAAGVCVVSWTGLQPPSPEPARAGMIPLQRRHGCHRPHLPPPEGWGGTWSAHVRYRIAVTLASSRSARNSAMTLPWHSSWARSQHSRATRGLSHRPIRHPPPHSGQVVRASDGAAPERS